MTINFLALETPGAAADYLALAPAGEFIQNAVQIADSLAGLGYLVTGQNSADVRTALLERFRREDPKTVLAEFMRQVSVQQWQQWRALQGGGRNVQQGPPVVRGQRFAIKPDLTPLTVHPQQNVVTLSAEEKEIIRDLEAVNGDDLSNSASEQAKLEAILARIEKIAVPTPLFNRALVYDWNLLVADVETFLDLPDGSVALLKRLEMLIDKIYASAVPSVRPQMLDGFTTQQLRLMVENIGDIELTKGCSVGCSFCGFNAQRGVTGHIPFGDLLYLMRNFGAEQKRRPSNEKILTLYRATEPLDYQDGPFTVEDVYAITLFYLRVVPQIVTALPKDREQVFWRLQAKGWIDDISIHGINLKRAAGSYGLLEPTDATAVGLKFYRFRRLDRPPKFRVFGDVAWRFKNDGLRRLFARAGRNFDGHYKPIGKSDMPDDGIDCLQGVTIKMDGFYNSAGVVPDSGNTSGYVEVKIGPDHFTRPLEVGRNYELQEAMRHGVVENWYQIVSGGIPLPLVVLSGDGSRRGFVYASDDSEYGRLDDFGEPLPQGKVGHAYPTSKVKILGRRRIERPGWSIHNGDLPVMPKKP